MSSSESRQKLLNLSLSKKKTASSSLSQTKIIPTTTTTTTLSKDKGKGRMDPLPPDFFKRNNIEKETDKIKRKIKIEPIDEDDYDDDFMMLDDAKENRKNTVIPEDEDMLSKQFEEIKVENRKRSRSRSLSIDSDLLIERPKPEKIPRKIQGEDVFSRSSVKTWQKPRIKAWEDRHINAEGYYFRFVVPGVGQQNGGWSNEERKLFMERYKEWISNGWKIGNSWGLFSKTIPHRVGYQCMNYYRKLLLEGVLKDDDYIVEGGKLKRNPSATNTGAPSMPSTELGPEWETDLVKEMEQDVNKWLKEYHGRSGVTNLSKPVKAPRIQKPIVVRRSNTNSISDLVKKMPVRPKIKREVGEEGDDFEDMETEAEMAHLEHRDLEAEWKERLTAYKAFIQPFSNADVREKNWIAQQKWRESLATTKMLIEKRELTRDVEFDRKSKNTIQPVQSLLSNYFSGVEKRKEDTPDEFIAFTRIPNELYYGVRRIKPISLIRSAEAAAKEKSYYKEVNDMNECLPILDDMLSMEEDSAEQSPLEGILMDPPWEYYVADGRNDGQCYFTIMDFKNLMEKLIKHMSSGIIFVWVHKLIQGDVIRLMYELDCKYIENLAWFKKSCNNSSVDRPSPYVSSTKEILLLFKKGDAIDLRHQRSPDVVIDFETSPQYWAKDEYTEPKPRMVHNMIQTMLPGGMYNEKLKRGKLLELWAKRSDTRREGWIAFHQIKSFLKMETEE